MMGGRERLTALAPSEQSFLGYLFWMSRPRFWLYLAGPVVVGVVFAADAPATVFSLPAVVLFVYFLVPANVFLYGVNDIFDADVDSYNPKKDQEGREVRYSGQSRVALVVALAATLGLLLVVFLPLSGVCALAGFFALGAQYSAPPLRLKTTPLFDSLSNGLYILPGVVAYTAIAGRLPPVLAIAGGWLWTMAMHTFSAIPDIEPDRHAGIRTMATVLGREYALGYCAGCWIGAAVVMALVHPFLGVVFAGYPLFVAAIVAADIDIDRAYWWFPVVNTVAGMILTMGGLWVITYG